MSKDLIIDPGELIGRLAEDIARIKDPDLPGETANVINDAVALVGTGRLAYRYNGNGSDGTHYWTSPDGKSFPIRDK